MAYSPSDFGPGHCGEQIIWLRERLAAHGYPSPTYWTEDDRLALQQFQLGQGWRGTQRGGGADGYPGPMTLQRLSADPAYPEPTPLGRDFDPFKVTLPVGEEEHPTELRPVRESAPWLVNRGDHWTFRAHKGGVSTSGSDNTRCELREMDPKAWDARDGRHHRLTVDLAVTHMHQGVPVVVQQIHNASDDVTVFRVEGSELWITNGDRSHGHRVTDHFEVGKRYVLGFDAYDGLVHFTVNGQPIDYTVPAAGGNYFKAGCYFQCAKYDIPDSAYAEVAIYGIGVSHD